jgi:hypothetical protein
VLQPVCTSAWPFAPYMVATAIGFVEWMLLPDVGDHLQNRDGVCRPGSCQNTMQPRCCTGGSQSSRAQLASPSSCAAPASRKQDLISHGEGCTAPLLAHIRWHSPGCEIQYYTAACRCQGQGVGAVSSGIMEAAHHRSSIIAHSHPGWNIEQRRLIRVLSKNLGV